MSAATLQALTFAQLATMDHAAFMRTLGGLFEHSPWVAEAAWEQRPYASVSALHDTMMAAVRGAPLARQLAFLNLHPELAGKEAQAGTMTGHSTFEQRCGGLDALSADELRELRALNARYAQRHGFPFIIHVLGHDKAQIFEALRTRAHRETDDERAAAFEQIASITRRRLHALFALA